MTNEALTIARLAKRAGVNVETIRYYQRRRLVPIPVSVLGGVRRYSSDYLRRVRFIKRAQQLDFSLAEIGDLLALADGNRCSLVCGVGERRLADIERKIADLVAMREALRRLVGACHENRPEAPCPLVEAFAT
ncbi:MAG TPA: MerR family DNA-binding protein [Burkholderiales bacterium]|jgi:MerR family mercuric resistance operon transcriptional regulator